MTLADFHHHVAAVGNPRKIALVWAFAATALLWGAIVLLVLALI